MIQNSSSYPAKGAPGKSALARTHGRKASKWRWIVVASLVVIVLLLAINAGRFLIVDDAQRSDAILVLAGETDRRIDRGRQVLDQGYGRTLIIDVPQQAKVYGFSPVELAHNYVAGLPQAASIRICPILGLSTKAESQEAEKCLPPEARSVLIVTSEFHTRRALSIFRHEIHGRSFSVAATYDDTQFGVDWWKRRQWAKTCVDEWLRMLWWEAVDRWH